MDEMERRKDKLDAYLTLANEASQLMRRLGDLLEKRLSIDWSKIYVYYCNINFLLSTPSQCAATTIQAHLRFPTASGFCCFPHRQSLSLQFAHTSLSINLSAVSRRTQSWPVAAYAEPPSPWTALQRYLFGILSFWHALLESPPSSPTSRIQFWSSWVLPWLGWTPGGLFRLVFRARVCRVSPNRLYPF